MIELFFVACLSVSPQQCQERALTFSDVSLMTCMTGAQAVLARWTGERPGWRVTRWRCGFASARGRSA